MHLMQRAEVRLPTPRRQLVSSQLLRRLTNSSIRFTSASEKYCPQTSKRTCKQHNAYGRGSATQIAQRKEISMPGEVQLRWCTQRASKRTLGSVRLTSKRCTVGVCRNSARQSSKIGFAFCLVKHPDSTHNQSQRVKLIP